MTSAAVQSVEDFFAGGVPAAKFEDKAYGTVIGGTITAEPRMQQQRDYTTGDPITYPDGNPAMQMVVIVQAYEAMGEDNGERAFYIRGQMKQAIGEALRKHGIFNALLRDAMVGRRMLVTSRGQLPKYTRRKGATYDKKVIEALERRGIGTVYVDLNDWLERK